MASRDFAKKRRRNLERFHQRTEERRAADRARTVHLPPMAVELLEALPREGSTWVFPGNNRDGRYTGGGLDHVWQTVRARAGLEDVRLHDLRHSLCGVIS